MASFVAAADQGCIICWRALQNLTPESQELLRYYARSLKPFEDSSLGFSAHPRHSTGAVSLCFTEVQISVMQLVDGFGKWCTPPGITLAIYSNPEHRLHMYEQGMIDDDANFTLRVIEKLQGPNTGIFRLTLHRSSEVNSNVVYLKPTSCDTGSAGTWELVRTWLDECTSSHRTCNIAKPAWYPSRLVDVGISGPASDSGRKFFIVKGTEVAPGQRYITFSHRWGASEIPQITVQSLPEFELGKPTSSLSKSFQDAIAIARRMRIRYIWIDSLCIIQQGDNGHDWRQEAPLMLKVYAHAFCNLAANWASGSNGLFFQRDLRFFNRVQQRLLLADDDDRIFSENYTLFSAGNVWDEEVLDAPLNKRGWVLQERILAPRILHFCRREVFWECCEKTYSESCPAGLLPAHPNTGNPLLSRNIEALKQLIHSPTFGLQRARPDASEARQLYGIWHGIVEIYSRCQLTKRSDKLIAISGLAQTLSSSLEGQYIAGVWTGNLVNDLIWYILEPEPVSRDCDRPYRSPSFSWASVDGHTVFPPISQYGPTGSLVQLFCIKPRRSEGHLLATGDTGLDELVTEDIFGPCESPAVELRVTGRLRTIFWRWSCQNGRPEAYESLHIEPVQKDPGFQSLIGEKAISFRLDCPLEEADCQGKLFYYMPWIESSTIVHAPGGGPNIPGVLIALILELVDAELGRFRRIGIMEAKKPTVDTKAVLLNSQKDESLYPCWKFDKTSGLHIIYII